MTDTTAIFSAPSLLTNLHNTSKFHSGETSLDDWLQQRALKNMIIGATRTYVICPDNSSRVVGYYALCMGQILGNQVTGAMRRNMPTHIPAVILGRLAVDEKWQGNGLGQALLFDAVSRSITASHEISARLIVVHAISRQAEEFYRKYGFKKLPVEAPTFALNLAKYKDIKQRPI